MIDGQYDTVSVVEGEVSRMEEEDHLSLSLLSRALSVHRVAAAAAAVFRHMNMCVV